MSPITFCGYFPGLIGKIVELHGRYYAEYWNFDVSFETQEGRELSIFVADFQESRDGLWAALVDGEFAGAIAIDGSDAHKTGARLRWFIVEPKYQGKGLGAALMERAVEFCKTAGFPFIYLWTFKGLDSARKLYLRFGFELTEERDVPQWGGTIHEQRYDLNLRRKA